MASSPIKRALLSVSNKEGLVDFARALREPEVADRMNNLGMVLMENGTDNYIQYMRDELQRYAYAVKVAGIKFE